jgi:hypothetical protein
MKKKPMKGGGLPGGLGGLGGGLPGGLGGLMQQAKKMQEDMEAARAQLENETTEVSVGGGAVTIVITGHQRIQSIKINAALIDTSDSEWATDLEDLLMVGLNQAVEQSQAMATEKMESISGGLGNLGGLFG